MTTQSRHDVIIVGARCAGATLATFLARAGASVLLLDKDRLPSDQILSTHTIHPPGVDVLDDLGSRAEHPISRQNIDTNAVKVLCRLHRQGYRGLMVGGSGRRRRA